MFSDKNTNTRNYWAANVLVHLACIVVSFEIGWLINGEFFWLLLSILFLAMAAYEAVLNMIVAEGAKAKLTNWQETLTDRFALEEFVSSIQSGDVLDNDEVWKRATNKTVSDIQAESTSRLISNPASMMSSWSKTLMTTILGALMTFAVTVVPALVAKSFDWLIDSMVQRHTTFWIG